MILLPMKVIAGTKLTYKMSLMVVSLSRGAEAGVGVEP